MSHAENIADNLRRNMLTAIGPVREAIKALQPPAAALATWPQDDPLNSVWRDVAQLCLASELLKDAAKALEQAGRDGLAETLADTGGLGVRIPGFKVVPTEPAPGVVITGTVPPGWMSAPAPSPDKARIAKALRAGERLEFATLANGRPGVSFRKETDQ